MGEIHEAVAREVEAMKTLAVVWADDAIHVRCHAMQTRSAECAQTAGYMVGEGGLEGGEAVDEKCW